MKIYHWNPDKDGKLNEENFKNKLEKMGYDVQGYTYSPNTSFEPHYHTCDKIDAILKGRFQVNIDGNTIVLKPGDYIQVPANKIHAARVVGEESVVSLDAIKRTSQSI